MKNTKPMDWKKLIAHIESGEANKDQIRLLLAVIVKALKDKQELSEEFVDYLERISKRYAKDDISLDQALLNNRKQGRKGNQPAELGGMPDTIGLVYRYMIYGTGKDSAINAAAAEKHISPSKLRDQIKFYKEDFIDSLKYVLILCQYFIKFKHFNLSRIYLIFILTITISFNNSCNKICNFGFNGRFSIDMISK